MLFFFKFKIITKLDNIINLIINYKKLTLNFLNYIYKFKY